MTYPPARMVLALSASTFISGFGLSAAPATYTPTSPWLLQPESLVTYIKESADFWKPAYDSELGGFYSTVDLTGNPDPSQGKAILIQGRNAYGMTKAYLVSGDSAYLPYADGALRFQYTYGWDETNGGWYGIVGSDGALDSGYPSWMNWANQGKWSFWQHYQLLGTLAYLEVTDDAFHWDWLNKGIEVNDLYLWDSRVGKEGYYDKADDDWSGPYNKGFTPTVDAVTTSAETTYQMTRDPARKLRLKQLGDNMADRLVASMDDSRIKAGFASSYNADWVINTGERNTSVGHFVKTSWCLARVFLATGDQKYRTAANKILEEYLTYGAGDPNKSLRYEDVNLPKGNIDIFNGTASGTADWWSMEQVVMAGLMNWYVSRDGRYLEMADKAIDFWMEHYYDRENGECFSVVDRFGNVTDNTKGQMFKGGYHGIELMYYTYLYSTLYLHNQPVTLHYEFKAEPQARDIILWPLSFEDEKLVVSSVKRNGRTYNNYNGNTRVLSLPANTGGKYEVTFESRYAFNFQPGVDDTWMADWMGWIWYDLSGSYPWIYHLDLGWIYANSGLKTGNWYYHQDPEIGWFYSNAENYPRIFINSTQTWVDVSAVK